MIFYQTTTQTVNNELLLDALLLHCKKPDIINLNFIGYPNVQTLEEALSIIETKRLKLHNPYNHNFLCIHIRYIPNIVSEDAVEYTNKVANSLSKHFHNDLYIISLVYRDDSGILHSVIIISDIEKSLDMSTMNYLEPIEVQSIFANALQNFYISPAAHRALFSFNGIDSELAYDGVFHVEHTAQLNSTQ